MSEDKSGEEEGRKAGERQGKVREVSGYVLFSSSRVSGTFHYVLFHVLPVKV